MKKLVLVIFAVCLSMSLIARNLKMESTKSKDNEGIYDGGFGIGSMVTNAASDAENFILFSYFSSSYEVNFGLHYEHIFNIASSPSVDLIGIYGDVGLRNRLFGNVYVAYGINGTGEYIINGTSPTPYAVGAFAAIECQITRHFLVSFKTYPYNYERTINSHRYHKVFETGTISASYVF